MNLKTFPSYQKRSMRGFEIICHGLLMENVPDEEWTE